MGQVASLFVNARFLDRKLWATTTESLVAQCKPQCNVNRDWASHFVSPMRPAHLRGEGVGQVGGVHFGGEGGSVFVGEGHLGGS